MSDALFDVRIVFRAAPNTGLALLECAMAEAERARLCREFAGAGGSDWGDGSPPPGPPGGVYEIVVGGKRCQLALRFADVLYVS
ncbi:MAG TPA: hypothetical protein PKD53_00565 [Chloroflexaceae bacterium]|nr:hypothetical protein [Chloroflexaceae bacterium]